MSKSEGANKVSLPNPGILLLARFSLCPVAYNQEAVRVLSYPNKPDGSAHTASDLEKHIGAKLVCHSLRGRHQFVDEFRSGDRVYYCRTMNVCLDGNDAADNQTTLILLERQASPSRLLERKASERFGLSPRERQMVELLIEGMTTKEMAEALNLSPNTIKSFLRLIMAKMGVSTRSGIVGKILDKTRA